MKMRWRHSPIANGNILLTVFEFDVEQSDIPPFPHFHHLEVGYVDLSNSAINCATTLFQGEEPSAQDQLSRDLIIRPKSSYLPWAHRLLVESLITAPRKEADIFTPVATGRIGAADNLHSNARHAEPGCTFPPSLLRLLQTLRTSSCHAFLLLTTVLHI